MGDAKSEIIQILRENARVPDEEIGAMLGIGAENVRKIISELENENVILKYKAIVNEEFVSERVEAIIEIKTVPERDYGFDKVAQRISNFPEVKNLFLVAGDYDLACMVCGCTMKDVASFVASKLSTIPNVKGTATHFLLKKYKEDNVSFIKKEKDQRLKVIA